MGALLTIAVASSVTLASFEVRAETDDASPVRTSVEVDTSQVGESGPVIQRRIRERSDVVLRREGVLPARGGQDPVILVTVFEASGDDPGYAFDLRAQREGKDLLHTERFQCRLCTETELVSEVETRLASVVGELGERARAADEAHVEATSEQPRPDEGVVLDTPERGLSPMGKAGIAVLVTGVVGLGVGVGLAIPEPRPKPVATHETTTRPPGYALIGLGAALAITGGVLLAVDVERKRRKRSTQAAQVGPWIGPAGAGMTLSGKF